MHELPVTACNHCRINKRLLDPFLGQVEVAECHAHQGPEHSYLSAFTTHFFNLPTQNSSILRNLYIKNDLTARAIAEISDGEWSKTAILSALQSLEIKKENRGTSYTKYGEKFVGGQRLPHQGEQKNIQKMLKLREEGNSFQRIASILIKQGIPNRSGGNWDKTTIGTIIKREILERMKDEIFN